MVVLPAEGETASEITAPAIFVGFGFHAGRVSGPSGQMRLWKNRE